ncbi:MAG: GNAT family N-acetyltransferase [Candidatus Odinarchaeota archaeon]
MIEYNIREPSNTEIYESIGVLYSSFGRTLNKRTNKEEEKAWRALIKNNIGKFLISEENGKIFGIGGVFIFGDVCTFGYMGVLPEYRGKGVGSKIFGELFKLAKDLGCTTMILYASKLGEPIYKKVGFKRSFYGVMYQLPVSLPELRITNKKVKVLSDFPNWLLNLDKEAMGFERSKYLYMKKNLGSQILAIEGEAYGLLSQISSKIRIGPLISTNLDGALQIIKKSIALGATQIIIAKHQSLPQKIFELIKLTEIENGASLKMVYRKNISENLDLLYAIGTFAKG